MKNLLLHDGRLRSGWRVSSYIVVSRLLLFLLLLLSLIVLALFMTAQGTKPDLVPQRMTQILTSLPGLSIAEIIQLALTVGVVYLWRRRVDNKSFRSLGIQLVRGWWQQVLLGATLVGMMWTFIFVFAFSTLSVSIEGMRLEPTSLLTGLGLGLAFNILVALNEELDARGYVLQNLAEGVGLTRAVIISAVYFGVLHLLNPGAGWASTLGVALFGALAALAYWATGQLWMPIGMHAAWNLFEGPLFGFPVSGLNLGGLFILQVNGPDWLTGGRFGPEAGALTIVPLLILIGAVYLWGRTRRNASTLSEDQAGKPEGPSFRTC